MKPTYTYDNISLVPRKLSGIRSRKDIDLSVSIKNGSNSIKLQMPIIPSPMDTICGEEMCKAFYQNGMLGIIHRFQSSEKRLIAYRNLCSENIDAIIAVGLDEEEIVSRHYDLGAKLFIVDVANGFNSSVEPIIKYISDLGGTFIICGNVASREGFEYLSGLGVDAIRVGIGTGSMCTTSIMTGVGQGIVSALMECKEAKARLKSETLIIADGGTTYVGDIAKALVIGADLVMMGRMFAGTKEAEGNILKYDGKLYKAFRGSASFAVQKQRGKNPYYIEGDETIVQYKGSVQNIFDEIEAGLRSALSYLAAKDLTELRKNASLALYHTDSRLALIH